MNIAVIAANGRSGKVFVEQALDAGHTVKAGVFGRSNFAAHEHLDIVQCDATNKDEVRALLHNQDAVVSFIGHVKGSPSQVQTDAMRVLVAAMEQQGIRRIVSLTGTGVRMPGDRITFVDRLLNLSIGIIDPARVEDGRMHVKVLQETDLHWTVIRVLKLQNVAPRPFHLTLNGPTKWYVGREDVARAVLQVLEKDSFIQQAPIISR